MIFIMAPSVTRKRVSNYSALQPTYHHDGTISLPMVPSVSSKNDV